MTTITKEAVLRAAEKSTPQEALKELFPEYFEEDTLAIKEGVFQLFCDDNLVEFCKKAKYDSILEDISNGVRPDKTGFQRDTLEVDELDQLKKIREGLKKLPVTITACLKN